MTKGFFDVISAADNEKVHSQVIGWIFHPSNDALTPIERTNLLNELVGETNISPVGETNISPVVNVLVEVEDIDILIFCEKEIVIIENKLKSGLHSNQLEKYDYLMDDAPSEEYKPSKNLISTRALIQQHLHTIYEDLKIVKRIKIYLSLFGEKAEGKWKAKSYADLYKILDKTTLANHPNAIIFQSYISTLANFYTLAEKMNEFPIDPSLLEKIFRESKKRKIEMIGQVRNVYETMEDYVESMQFQTILQKWFYVKIQNQLFQKENTDYTISIGETHGQALLDIHFTHPIFLKQTPFKLILQFQGIAIKIGLVLFNQTNQRNLTREEKKADPLIKEQLSLISEIFLPLIQNVFSLEKSKFSTPQSINGFMSININPKNQEHWQLQDKPHLFVKSKIVQLLSLIETLSVHSPLTSH